MRRLSVCGFLFSGLVRVGARAACTYVVNVGTINLRNRKARMYKGGVHVTSNTAADLLMSDRLSRVVGGRVMFVVGRSEV